MYPTIYEEAREAFITAAEKSGYRHLRLRIPHENTEFFQDYALLRRDPKRLLVHLSGVHGIEGYVGSAVQCSLLAETPKEDGPSLLFIHAVNPYGMAFYRRANSKNVDLNRNFRTGPAKPNPDYKYFNSYLNPQNRLQFLTGPLSAFVHRHRFGAARTSMAIASGQVENPKGLFYMGTSVQKEVIHCQEFLKSHGSSAQEIVVIDLHTGLGEFGEEVLIAENGTRDEVFFAKVFDQPTIVPDPETNGIYDNQGPLSSAFRAALPSSKVHYVVQEFGTLSAFSNINALRKENYEWLKRGDTQPPSLKTQTEMLAHFFPENPAWRERVLSRGRLRWQQAEKFLQASP